jgi:hypothetical protein
VPATSFGGAAAVPLWCAGHCDVVPASLLLLALPLQAGPGADVDVAVVLCLRCKACAVYAAPGKASRYVLSSVHVAVYGFSVWEFGWGRGHCQCVSEMRLLCIWCAIVCWWSVCWSALWQGAVGCNECRA